MLESATGLAPPANDTVTIRPLRGSDGDAVLRIYQAGINTGHATFERAAPYWAEWQRRHLERGRLAATIDTELVGWAALSPTSVRAVYSGVAEVSVYVSPAVHGRGVGRRLLAALVDASEWAGIWTLQSSIFPDNRASLALHHALGFRQLGIRRRIGRMEYGPLAGRWRDVVLLERRSAVAGRD